MSEQAVLSARNFCVKRHQSVQTVLKRYIHSFPFLRQR
nr:MAG TPA: hypothetical protein [Caudoviricetes sp.]